MHLENSTHSKILSRVFKQVRIIAKAKKNTLSSPGNDAQSIKNDIFCKTTAFCIPKKSTRGQNTLFLFKISNLSQNCKTEMFTGCHHREKSFINLITKIDIILRIKLAPPQKFLKESPLYRVGKESKDGFAPSTYGSPLKREVSPPPAPPINKT